MANTIALSEIEAFLPTRHQVGLSSAAMGSQSPLQVINAARAAGLDGVEWGIGAGHPLELHPSLAAIRLIGQASTDAGLACCGVSMHDADALARPLSDWEAVADMASQLGARHIRAYPLSVTSGPGVTFEDDIAHLQRLVAERAVVVANSGLRLLVEPSPRTLAPSPYLGLKAISVADSRHVGVVFDPGSLAQEGWVDPNLAMRILGSATRHVHVKNVRMVARRPSGWRWAYASLSTGVVRWKDVINALGSISYDGWFVLDHLSSNQTGALLSDASELREILSGHL